MTLTKTYEAQFKALDEKAGTFEAIVSVFGNVDLIGDRVLPGAFTKSIEDWRAKGDPIPIIWSHQWKDPNAHIGSADPDDVEQTDKGLVVKGALDLDNPFAAQVYRLIKSRRVKEWSFAYDVPTGGESRGKDGANNINTAAIIEAGPTLKGMNGETDTIGVKSAEKAWLYLDGSMEQFQDTLREAVQAWASAQGTGGWAYVEASYPDRVVFGVETYSGGTWHDEYYEASYTIDTDGGVVLGDVVTVELQATAVAKSRALLTRAMKSNSDTPSGKAEEPGRANASREATSAEEPSGANAPKRSLFEMELDLAVSELPSA